MSQFASLVGTHVESHGFLGQALNGLTPDLTSPAEDYTVTLTGCTIVFDEAAASQGMPTVLPSCIPMDIPRTEAAKASGMPITLPPVCLR